MRRTIEGAIKARNKCELKHGRAMIFKLWMVFPPLQAPTNNCQFRIIKVFTLLSLFMCLAHVTQPVNWILSLCKYIYFIASALRCLSCLICRQPSTKNRRQKRPLISQIRTGDFTDPKTILPTNKQTPVSYISRSCTSACFCVHLGFVQVGCCKQHSWSRIATELFLGAVKFVGGVVGWYRIVITAIASV